jgi:gliding motility-associated-like protein
MDASGKFTSAVDLAYAGSFVEAYRIDIGPKDEIITYNYLNGSFGGYTINSTVSPASGSTFVWAICKHDSSGKILSWNKLISLNDQAEPGALAVDDAGDVYYGFRASSSRTINGVSSGSGTPIFIIKLNGSNGNAVKTIKSATSTRGQLQRMTTIGSKLFIQGYTINDSFNILGKSFKVLGASVSNRAFYYLACLKGLDSVQWSLTSTYNRTDFVGDSRLTRSGLFIYSSFRSNTDSFKIGGLSVFENSRIATTVCKFDTLGNALWILKNPSSVPPLVEPIDLGDLVYSGGFFGTAVLDPFTLKKSGSTIWPFIARTTDYRIFRGQVKSGPFCAGDSFKIPYTKDGIYGNTNEFIAEISDEEGRFTGGERILGRLKATADSVINGVLPLLKLPTSNLYRIRVRSTVPAVQSFFREDTLRLLIYSRDKADPGSDTSVFIGDTFMLSTFGGTTWTWSPAVNMSDSTSRTPRIWPTQATTYKIIIGDSSGCGAPDTASVNITLKSPPKITSSKTSDSTACIGQEIKINANFAGGINIFTAHWCDNNYKILKTSNLVTGDSFVFTFLKDTIINLIVTDSCATVNDSATFTFKVKPALIRTSISSDTTICYGNPLTLAAAYSHAVPDSLDIVWTNSRRDTLSNLYSFTRIYKKSDSFFAQVSNTCDKSIRSDTVIVLVRDTLNTKIQGKNNFYCRGATLNLANNTSGGNGNVYYRWRINGNIITESTNLSIPIDSLFKFTNLEDSINILLEVTDSCTSKIAFDSVWIKAKAQLRFVTSNKLDSLLCQGNLYTFTMPASGGIGNYAFQWNLSNASSQDSVWVFNPALVKPGSFTLFGILTDNCSSPDTFRTIISISDSLKVSIDNVLDTVRLCLGENRTFSATKSGGKLSEYEFNWRIGNTSTSQNDLVITANKTNTLRDTGYWLFASLADGCTNHIAQDSVYIAIENPPMSSLSKNKNSSMQIFDTTLCFGASWTIKPDNYYGKPSKYSRQWLVGNNSLGTQSLFVFDNTVFNGQDSTISILYVLSDSCSSASDTLTINIKVLKALNAPILQDTTLCYGSSFAVQTLTKGGKSNQYVYEWKNLNNNAILSTTNSVNLTNLTNPLTVVLQTTDNCSFPAYSDTFNIGVKDRLQLSVTPKDTCISGNVILQASGKGGNLSDHRFQWWLNNSPQNGTLNNLLLSNIDTTTRYKTVLQDGCSLASDTFYGVISPKPIFTYNQPTDTSCAPLRHNIQIRSINKETHRYELYVNDLLQSSINALLLNQGNYKLAIISNNNAGCSDTQTQNLVVKPRPIPSFTFDPKSPNDDKPTVTFTANNPGYNAYEWTLDGATVSTNSAFAYTFTDSGTYTINLSVNLDGCQADSSARVTYRRVYQYYGVNTFSPNGDGKNDFYQPVFSGVSEVNFIIFNRWGQKVFDSQTDGPKWDGNYMGKPVPIGQYAVLIYARDMLKNPYSIKQNLVLYR